MENNIRYIYTLSCPITEQVRYVGQTLSLKQRLKKHIATSQKPRYHTQCWINSLLAQGLKPVMDILETCTIDTVDSEERFYISLLRSWGFDLTNMDSGGCFEKVRSKETIKKVSDALRGRKQTEETKLKRKLSVTEAWKDEGLREVQRKRTKELHRLGIISQKGKPSKKKGKPFQGDKNKVSLGLKKYYQTHESHNKHHFQNIKEVIADYKNTSLPLKQIAKKYGVHRTFITTTMKKNGIELRNNGKKFISKETLTDLLINKNMSIAGAAKFLNCSTSNIDKFKKLHSVYIQ